MTDDNCTKDTQTQNIINALKELAEPSNKPKNIFDVLRVMMKHCGDNIENITLSGTQRVKR
jgi:hypothetical protein